MSRTFREALRDINDFRTYLFNLCPLLNFQMNSLLDAAEDVNEVYENAPVICIYPEFDQIMDIENQRELMAYNDFAITYCKQLLLDIDRNQYEIQSPDRAQIIKLNARILSVIMYYFINFDTHSEDDRRLIEKEEVINSGLRELIDYSQYDMTVRRNTLFYFCSCVNQNVLISEAMKRDFKTRLAQAFVPEMQPEEALDGMREMSILGDAPPLYRNYFTSSTRQRNRFMDDDEDEDEDEEGVYGERQRGEVAYEIHNAFGRLNIARLKEILTTVVADASSEYEGKAQPEFFEWIHAKFRETLQKHSADLSGNENPTTYIEALAIIIDRLKHIENVDMPLIGSVVVFVYKQPEEFIWDYVHTFIKDSATAYSNNTSLCDIREGALSCTKGMYERFVTILESVLITTTRCLDAPTEPSCKDVYKLILKDIFNVEVSSGKMIKADINEFVNDWQKEHITNKEYHRSVVSQIGENAPAFWEKDCLDYLTKRYKEFLSEATENIPVAEIRLSDEVELAIRQKVEELKMGGIFEDFAELPLTPSAPPAPPAPAATTAANSLTSMVSNIMPPAPPTSRGGRKTKKYRKCVSGKAKKQATSKRRHTRRQMNTKTHKPTRRLRRT